MATFLAEVQQTGLEDIERLEQEMLAIEGEHGIELEQWHHFADGLVARTIFIPAGTTLTGAEHRAEHLNVCFGDISVTTDAGVRRLTGYHVLPAIAGSKRAGYAHADTWWTTVHLNPGNERDLAKLEDALVADAASLQRQRAPELPHIVTERLA